MRRGAWKYLRIDEFEYLFNIEEDQRERANRAAIDPSRLEGMRVDFERWEQTVPPIPEGAAVSVLYTKNDMP